MLKCGLYEMDITPALGMEMPGHFMVRPAKSIWEKLYCHASYFDNGEERAVIISSDSITIPDCIVDVTRNTIAEKLDMKAECVLLCATHTHYGGPVETWGEFVHLNKEYVEFLSKRYIDCVVMAALEAREVVIGYSKGYEDKIAYYRDFVMSDGSFRTNPGMGDPGKRPFGEIDKEVGVLRIDTADGIPYGALINYACHCDCVGGMSFSADYPGELKKLLKKVYGDDFVPVFINGFSGNINHCDYFTAFNQYPKHYKRMGRMLAADVIRTREYSETFEGEIKISGKDCKMAIPTREPSAELIKWADEILALPDPKSDVVSYFYALQTKDFQAAGVQMIDAIVQVIQIGDLAIYGMPGEIFVEFGLDLKEQSPVKYNMHANLANGCIGYVLIRELFQPGIYEARLCVSSKMTPDAGYMMVDKLLELAEEL